MPKINLNVKFLDKDNEPLLEPVRDKYKLKKNNFGVVEAEFQTHEDGTIKMKEVILRDVVVDILQDSYEGDNAVGGADKLRRHVLAQKVLLSDGKLNLDYDEITMIRELAAKKRPTLVIGRIDEAVNATEPKEEVAAG